MKHIQGFGLVVLLGLIVLGMVAFAASPAGAATAAGPYYATPSWDQTLPAATRFIVLTNMNSEAVLDRETGLVWEQSPSTSTFVWLGASIHCIDLNAGGRAGWRLPTIQELLSLVDRSVSPGPTLPSGHPFSNVQSGVSSFYWSATVNAGNGTSAWSVRFGDGNVFRLDFSLSFLAWCVRGGRGADAQ